MTEVIERAGFFMLPELAREFILAGNARFTLVSKSTGKRFTYKVSKPSDWQVGSRNEFRFCSLLTGSNNENDYRYFGFMVKENGGWKYFHGKPGKACASRASDSVRAFTYTLGNLIEKNQIPDGVEIWHEGQCGRCGRTLTKPDSIESGFGPECIHHIGGM
jgi:hypothetical protein